MSNLLNEIQIIWSVDDVMNRAEEQDIVLSQEDACKILYNLKKYHDASVGINWDVIDTALDMYLAEGKHE